MKFETTDDLLSIYRLKNIVRYNTRPHLKDESVAEHSFYVAVFALAICEHCKVDEDVTRKCLIKALLHDMPEMDLNDITHDAKVKLNLYPYLKPFEDTYFKEHFPEYADIMNGDDKLVNAIVDLADVTSVYQFTLNEIKLGNISTDIFEIRQEAKDRIEKHEATLKALLEDKQ